jgi:RNA polymerase sigma factor (sigma-70 family)
MTRTSRSEHASAWSSPGRRRDHAANGGPRAPAPTSTSRKRVSRASYAVVPSRSRPSTHVLPPFERVVELHGPALLRFCAAQAGPDRAEDVFQETMLAALTAYGEVRDPGVIRSWLFSIAVRKAVDSHRARARAPEPVEDLEPLVWTQAPAYRDDALWTRVRRLPEKQRHAVALRYLADLSHGEIAAVMETTDEAARRNVFEGLTRLRKDLTP